MIYLFFGPFCRIIVFVYSMKNVDQFGWGKTRQVIAEDNDDPASKDEKSQATSTDASKTSSSEKLPERVDPSEEEKKIGS